MQYNLRYRYQSNLPNQIGNKKLTKKFSIPLFIKTFLTCLKKILAQTSRWRKNKRRKKIQSQKKTPFWHWHSTKTLKCFKWLSFWTKDRMEKFFLRGIWWQTSSFALNLSRRQVWNNGFLKDLLKRSEFSQEWITPTLSTSMGTHLMLKMCIYSSSPALVRIFSKSSTIIQ